jgi:hypothetical protein
MIAFKIKTFTKPILFLAVLVCTLLDGAYASTCITAGRMDTAGWAPQFKSVHLLNEAGRVLVVKNKSELKQVKAVELKEAALLSVCDGNKSLTRGDDATIKGAVPAAIPGRFNVIGLSFPMLQTGGELVEFEITVTADQIAMITR